MVIEDVMAGQNFVAVEGSPSVVFKKIDPVTDRFDNVFVAVAPDGQLADTDTLPIGCEVRLTDERI